MFCWCPALQHRAAEPAQHEEESVTSVHNKWAQGEVLAEGVISWQQASQRYMRTCREGCMLTSAARTDMALMYVITVMGVDSSSMQCYYIACF